MNFGSLGFGRLSAVLGSGFSPASLFAASEPGGWYDPSDLTTLFQDTAGTTPVTATGQTVARINDKSGRGNHATQATAASRPIYQVDGNGKAYLLFDGTDDFLVTPTITPGIDKAQVFAGVRKLSDASAGVIAETTTDAVTDAGLAVIASAIAGGVNQFSWGVAAGAYVEAYRTYTSPDTKVISASLDSNSAPKVATRLNGSVMIASSVSGVGVASNFVNSPLYIGRRAGTSLPFNGRLYGLITRFGTNLSEAQIKQTETWMNSKTGAY